MAANWTMKKGDLLPILDVTLEDANGAVDLSGATSINFKMVLNDNLGSAPKIDAAATPDPDQVTNKGKCTYTWASDDTDTVGVFYGEFEADYAGKKLTFPNDSYYIIAIVDDVDTN